MKTDTKLRKALLVGTAILFFLVTLFAALRSAPVPHDFPLAVYYPVRAFLDGQNPYDQASYLARYPASDPFAPYPPVTLLLHLPFGLPSPSTAHALYVGAMAALTVVLAFLSFRFNGVRTGTATVFLVAGLIVLSRPGRMNLVLGNVTLQIVIAMYVALYYGTRRSWISALGLAVAMVKPSFGLPLAVLMLALGHTPSVIRAAAITISVNLLLFAILATQAGGVPVVAAAVLETLQEYQTRWAYNDPLYSPIRIDAVSLLARFAGTSVGGVEQVIVGISVVGLAAVALGVARRTTPELPIAFTAGIVGTATLLSTYHQPYDILLLTLPAIAAAWGHLPDVLNRPAARAALIGLYVLPAVNYLTTFRVLDKLGLVAQVSELDRAVLSRSPLVVALIALNGLVLLSIFIVHLVAAARGLWTSSPDGAGLSPAGRTKRANLPSHG